jgi:hypothetical protein
MDPVDRWYAPPGDGAGPAPAKDGGGGDPLGWALIALPVVGGVAEVLLPSSAGTAASYATLFATIVLIGVDAHRHRQQAASHVWKAVLLWVVFYPVYMHERARWGAPRRLALAIGATLFFTGTGIYRVVLAGDTRVQVSCKPSGQKLADGFECSAVHVKGTATVETCWDLALTCASGPGGGAHQCARVVHGQTTTVRIAYASLSGQARCDKLTQIDVNGLEVKE